MTDSLFGSFTVGEEKMSDVVTLIAPTANQLYKMNRDANLENAPSDYDVPLKHYDVIFGFKQSAINSVVAQAFCKLSSDQKWLEFGDVWSEDSTVGAALVGLMLSPTVHFDLKDVAKAMLSLTFDTSEVPLASEVSQSPKDSKADYYVQSPGQPRRPYLRNLFSYVEVQNWDTVVQNFDATGWRLDFEIDLSVAEIDLNDPSVPEVIRQKLTNFDTSSLALDRIFLDLSRIRHLELSSSSHIPLPTWVSRDRRNQILAKLAVILEAKKLADKGRETLLDLGFALRQKPNAKTALVEPTSCVVSTKRYTHIGGRPAADMYQRNSTLNFLMATKHHNIEKRVRNFGSFKTTNLIEVGNPGIGAMVLPSYTFSETVVQPIWQALLGGISSHTHPLYAAKGAKRTHIDEVRQSIFEPTWTWNYDLWLRENHGDVHNWYDKRSISMTRQNIANGVRFSGSGQIAIEAKFQRYRDCNLFGWHHEGDSWQSASTNLSFSMDLLIDQMTGHLIIKPSLPSGRYFENSALHQDSGDDAGFILSTSIDHSHFASRFKDIENSITNDAYARVSQSMATMQRGAIFGLPGDLHFARPRMTDEYDLIVDLELK